MLEKYVKDGDKVAFIEKNGGFMVVNPVSLAVDMGRESFKGEAKRLNLKNQDDLNEELNCSITVLQTNNQ